MAAPAELVISASDIDVGEVWEQEAFRCKLTMQNTTENNVAIDGFRSSCGCVSIEPSALTIPSKQKAEVLVTLNLKLRTGQENMDFGVQIAPFLPAGNGQQPPVWTIRGHARRLMKLNPQTITYYEKQLVRGQDYCSQSVLVSPSIELDSLLAKCPAELATVEVARRKENNNSFQINITPRKSLPVGPFRFDVLLEPVREGKVLPIMKLPVEGKVLGDIQAFPDSLILGARNVGEIVTETLTLRSVDDIPFDVTRAWVDSTDTTVESTTVAGVSEKVFRIRQHVTKPGKQEFSIRFSVTKNGKCSTVPVNGSYHGTPVNGGDTRP